MKILIVDEDVLYLDLMKKHLYDFCDELITESNPISILFNRINIEKFDLIITDLKVNGISSVELIQKIREVKPHINIILHTSNKNVDEIKKTKKLGIDAFFLKPGHTLIIDYIKKYKKKDLYIS